MQANSLPEVADGLSAVMGGEGEGRRKVSRNCGGRAGSAGKKFQTAEDGQELECVGCTCKLRGCRGI